MLFENRSRRNAKAVSQPYNLRHFEISPATGGGGGGEGGRLFGPDPENKVTVTGSI